MRGFGCLNISSCTCMRPHIVLCQLQLADVCRRCGVGVLRYMRLASKTCSLKATCRRSLMFRVGWDLLVVRGLSHLLLGVELQNVQDSFRISSCFFLRDSRASEQFRPLRGQSLSVSTDSPTTTYCEASRHRVEPNMDLVHKVRRLAHPSR